MSVEETADRLQFFFFSRPVAAGKGTGEHVEDLSVYHALGKTFRQSFSNFGIVNDGRGFVCSADGRTYLTVEHAFQAIKLKRGGPEGEVKAWELCLDSGSDLSSNPGSEARNCRKAVILGGRVLAQWNEDKKAIMEGLWNDKFKQDDDAQRLLLLTGKAQLWHAGSRILSERWTGLEAIRDTLIQHAA
jgi:predicted NAD-dependent protein-ADP-ribosyltransferase YbiA (DUF1768 family)